MYSSKTMSRAVWPFLTAWAIISAAAGIAYGLGASVGVTYLIVFVALLAALPGVDHWTGRDYPPE